MRLPRLQPGAERELALTVTLLSLLLIGSAGYWARLAPGGHWVNQVFDVPIWNEDDPGGWYIAGAHDTLLHPGRTCFGGHPGTPLTLLLAGQQAALYGWGLVSGVEPGLTRYVARHMREVWILGKIGIAATHLLSLFLLYRYARELVRRDLAFLAVALYATSFPTAFYQTRVAPEPVMNVFFLGTLVALIQMGRPGIRERSRLGWAALAGGSAISAFLTKLFLMAAWPLYAASWIIVVEPPSGAFGRRQRLRLLGAYAGGAAAAAIAYAPFSDWAAFSTIWGTHDGASAGGALGGRLNALQALLHAIRRMPLLNLVPELTQSNAFFFFEFVFLLAAAAGIILFLRRPPAHRRLLIFSLGYCVVVAGAWFYRGLGQDYSGFHYLFPVMLVLAPMAALSAGVLVPAVGDTTLGRGPRALLMALIVMIVHHGALFGVFNSKCQDVLSYEKTGAALVTPVLATLQPGQRIGVIGRPPSILHGVSDKYAREGRRSALLLELEDVLRELPHADVTSVVKQATALDVVYILDLSASEPRGAPVEAWRLRLPRQDGREPGRER